MDFLKNGLFLELSFLAHLSQQNVLCDILEGKNAFLGYKNKKSKNSKNWHFSKGVNPRFWSKNSHFANFFFLGIIGLEKVFYDILERKNAFLGYKNNKFKKSKNWHFSKGLNPWISSKNGLFLELFFFSLFLPAKCPLWHSRTKTCLSRL